MLFVTDANNWLYANNDVKEVDAKAGNDIIYTNPTGTTVTGGKGDAENYSLNGKAGNDILQGGVNATLNGGSGSNVLLISAGDNVIIKQGKGADYIHFADNSISNMSFTKDGNSLVMLSGDSSSNITRVVLVDYFKYGTRSSIKGIVSTDDGVSIDYEKSIDEIVSIIKNASDDNRVVDVLSKIGVELNNVGFNLKKTILGTAYHDTIDLSDVILTKTIGKGIDKQVVNKDVTDKGLTISAQKGNDIITGTIYSDTITAGAGENTIYATTGNDVIKLTKSEVLNLVLDASAEDIDFAVAKNKRDLEILFKNDSDRKITIKDYYSKEC